MGNTSKPKRKLALREDIGRKRARRSSFLSVTGSPVSEEEDAAHYSCGSVFGDSPASLTTNPSTLSSPPSRKYPSESKTHHCTFEGCSKSFNRPARLVEHTRSHTKERPFRCQEIGCDKDFLRESHLSHHVKSAHTSIRDYRCDWEGCSKSFLTATRLRRHNAAHQGREKYRCSEYPPCNQSFRKHNTLQKHVVSIHLNQKPFPCPHIDSLTELPCTGAFDTAGRLKAHESRIHGDIRFWCTNCESDSAAVEDDGGVGFSSYAEFQEHLKLVHPPQCLDCGQVCASQRDLKQHLEIAHEIVDDTGKKMYTCEVANCGKEFTKKYNLTMHKRTVHEKQKSFICGGTDLSNIKGMDGWKNSDGCSMAFTTRQNLEEHIRTQHLHLPRRRKMRKQVERTSESTQSGTKAGPIPTISALTGIGYGDATGRSIPCVVDGCKYRLTRTYDLKVHLRSFHKLEEDVMQETIVEQQNAEDVDIWGLQDPLETVWPEAGVDEEEQLSSHRLAADLGLQNLNETEASFLMTEQGDVQFSNNAGNPEETRYSSSVDQYNDISQALAIDPLMDG